MKHYISLISIGVLLLFFCSCVKEELAEESALNSRISFVAVSGGIDEDASVKSAMESQVIELRSDDGTVVIPMAVRVSDGIETVSTKGQLINAEGGKPLALHEALNKFQVYGYDGTDSIFDELDNEATWNATKGRWDMDRPYYWPSETTLDFYAYGNMPASEEMAYVTWKPTEQKQVLHYEVPNRAEDQTDIIMAVYRGTGNASGEAELTFAHPLSAVQFSLNESYPDLEGTIDITMEGVYFHGDAEQTLSNPGVFTWKPSDEEIGWVTQDNHGLPLVVHGTASKKIQGDPFLIIPQKNSEDSRILLRVTMLINGHRIPLNATLDSFVWTAGKTYTYVIGYTGGLKVELKETSPSEEVKQDVYIENTDVKTAYVRAMVLGYITDEHWNIKSMWVNDDGSQKGSFSVTSGEFGSTSNPWNESWIKGTDGFFYYKKPVESDAETTPLFNEYRITDIGTNNHFKMDIAVQSVEYDANKKYVKATWGDYAASLLQ